MTAAAVILENMEEILLLILANRNRLHQACLSATDDERLGRMTLPP